MDTVIYCTHNVLPIGLLKKTAQGVIEHIKSSGRKINAIFVSHYPLSEKHVLADIDALYANHCDMSDIIQREEFLNFDGVDAVNLVVREREYNIFTIQKQVLLAANSLYCGDSVVIMEHDVLYPEGYLDRVFSEMDAQKKDFLIYKESIHLNYSGFCDVDAVAFSRHIFKKDFLIKYLSKMLNDKVASIEPRTIGSDSSGGMFEVYDSFGFISGNPTLDIHHGANTTGYVLAEENFQNNEYWGESQRYLDLIDDKYRNFLENHNRYFLGVFE